MDNLTIAEADCITKMRDQWLISNNKTNLNFTTWLKKTTKAKRKQKVKLDKNRQKT